MTPSPVLPASAAPVAPPESAAASSTLTLSADFETFLQMLTTQAKYQDPLEPVSSSDYAAQLAQFSMVEQQVFTNDQLGALANAMGSSTISTLANWVGMEARTVASALYDGAPITVSPNPAPTADRAQLVIYNDFGNEVGRRDIPVSSAPYQWDGRDQTGQDLGAGSYAFSVESFLAGELLTAEPAEIYARITEAQIVEGETVLKLTSGATVPTDQVTALREPGI